MRLPILVMSLTAALAGNAGLSAASADGPSMSISTWGNRIVVTGPTTDDSDQSSVALAQRISVDFKESSIEDVAKFLRSVCDENIVVAPALLNNATPMTLKAQDMTLGNVLSWVATLTGAHVGFVHGAIYLSDKPTAGASKTVIYDVSDLVLSPHDFPGPTLGFETRPGKGGVFNPPVAKDDTPTTSTEDIVDLIKKVISPGDWHD